MKMYYLKYRPKKIEDIDNLKVKEIVLNILKSKSLPHAFLFVGQKGTGKTSTARIFSKSVNCLKNAFSGHGNSFEPCNICDNCIQIESAASPDVVELDAASNRGIDDVKRLIAETSFLPMSGKYRVFIIDEAHMITPEAFNALLKTLEEPPKNVIFILATTNKEKLPKTILSRCLNVNFGKADLKDIARMLKRITDGEKIQCEQETLELVARNSENSFRDAAKVLEELVTQDKLTFEKAKEFIGDINQNFLELLSDKKLSEMLLWIEQFEQRGGNFKNLIYSALQDLHVELTRSAIEGERGKSALKMPEIVKLMKLLSEAYTNMRNTPIDSLPIEIAVVEFYNSRTV